MEQVFTGYRRKTWIDDNINSDTYGEVITIDEFVMDGSCGEISVPQEERPYVAQAIWIRDGKEVYINTYKLEDYPDGIIDWKSILYGTCDSFYLKLGDYFNGKTSIDSELFISNTRPSTLDCGKKVIDDLNIYNWHSIITGNVKTLFVMDTNIQNLNTGNVEELMFSLRNNSLIKVYAPNVKRTSSGNVSFDSLQEMRFVKCEEYNLTITNAPNLRKLWIGEPVKLTVSSSNGIINTDLNNKLFIHLGHNLKTLDLRATLIGSKCTADIIIETDDVPELIMSQNRFMNVNAIYVKDELVEEWKKASGWSAVTTVVSKITPLSECPYDYN